MEHDRESLGIAVAAVVAPLQSPRYRLRLRRQQPMMFPSHRAIQARQRHRYTDATKKCSARAIASLGYPMDLGLIAFTFQQVHLALALFRNCWLVTMLSIILSNRYSSAASLLRICLTSASSEASKTCPIHTPQVYCKDY